LVHPLRDHPPDRDFPGGLTTHVVAERSLETGETHLVDPHGARKRVTREPSETRRRSHDDSGLWSTEELVAAEADHVGTGGDALLRHRFVGKPIGRRIDQRPAAQVVYYQDAVHTGNADH